MALSVSWLIQLIIHTLVLSNKSDKIQTSQKRERLETPVWLTWIWDWLTTAVCHFRFHKNHLIFTHKGFQGRPLYRVFSWDVSQRCTWPDFWLWCTWWAEILYATRCIGNVLQTYLPWACTTSLPPRCYTRVSTIHWIYLYSSCLPHTSSHLLEHLTHGNVAELHKVDDINTNTLYVYVSVGGPDMLTQLQYISLRHYTERCLHGWKFQWQSVLEFGFNIPRPCFDYSQQQNGSHKYKHCTCMSQLEDQICWSQLQHIRLRYYTENAFMGGNFSEKVSEFGFNIGRPCFVFWL